MLKRIVVLISGGGTNLQAIIDACESHSIPGEVVGVISNQSKAYGLERALNHNISNFYFGKKNFPDKEVRNSEMITCIQSLKPDLIVLAGYLAILEPSFIQAFEHKIINVHPSLIPKYAGKGYYGMRVHEAVVENKEAYSGATVHYVDELIDTGQIIIQESVKLQSDETPESLQRKVLKIEHDILVRSINKYLQSEI
ncbi:MAG: phosphoribosylglycinamide formyltransferase [Clostridiales bacterium]|nr:phosphoribosylglycinamide formyltransferase [Clostridiales bacterium]